MHDKWQLELHEIRRQFNKGNLTEKDMNPDPFVQFSLWFCEAEKACRYYPNHMTLASVDEKGAPQSRIVLLKGADSRGFVFYTNYNSRKSRHLLHNSAASITFFWEELERQVNISGMAHQVSAKESDAYFASRPRGSQLGAWVSQQSEKIDSRKVLTEELSRLEVRYRDQAVPRPEHWGGFCVVPQRIEFWQGQPDRLHDRFEYLSNGDDWRIQRLSP